MIILTIASDLSHPGLRRLEASLQQYGYRYHVINAPFRFGGQSPHIYEWARQQPPNKGFLYTDAYDTVALGPVTELAEKLPYEWPETCDMLISVEKACFPHPQLTNKYPPSPKDTHWRFVNGGGWITTTGYFCRLFEDKTYDTHQNDQLWLTHEYLSHRHEILLDYNCEIFQSIAFEADDDFTYGERLVNNKTGSSPLFIHGNGRTSMKRIYELPCLQPQCS
jgi:hypothetical protein